MSPRRVISFARSAVALEWTGARAHAIAEFLFPFASPAGDIPPHVTFRLEPCDLPPPASIPFQEPVTSNSAEPLPVGLALYRDGTRALVTDDGGQIAELLLGQVSFHLVDQSAGGVVLHAGALASREHGILVAGGTGAGKSTLTAWLAARGFDYLTDELVWIPEGSDRLECLPRPLSIKPPSRAVLESFVDWACPGAVYHGSDADLIAPSALHSTFSVTSPHLRMILFPQHAPSIEPELEQLSKAQTGLALMAALLNARNLQGQGFGEVARLARSVPGYRLRYSTFGQIEKGMEQVLTSMPTAVDARRGRF